MRCRRGMAALAAAVLAVLGSNGLAWAGEPILQLSWHAPYGHPRASETLSFSCSDSATQDTLFLTYVTGRTSTFFVGSESELYLRAPAGDTLPSFWHLDAEGRSNFRVEFAPDSVPGCTRPFLGAQGFAGTFFDRTSGSGRLRLTQVVPIKQPVPVRDSTQYLLAEIILRRPTGQDACRQPLCVEWARADFALDSMVVTKAGRAGPRFVSWNSRDRAICAPFRPTGPEPWRPKVPGSPKK